jgi:cytochrome c peroxidase
MKKIPVISLLLLTVLVLQNCKPEPPPPPPPFNPTPLELERPFGFPLMIIPDDNPTTVEGVELGRMLFYDPILSGDNSQSCADCHSQDFVFSDNGKRFSTGIDGSVGDRNAPTIINAGWNPAHFWDGRAATLEEQALDPVRNPIEMNQPWTVAMDKLNAHPDYPDLFYSAFGTYEIDSMLVVKAIAQFERSMISSESKFDKFLNGEAVFTDEEQRGFEIYFTEKGDCFHCHGTVLLTDNEFHNNGLDSVLTDPGLGGITGNPSDLGRFKSPSLRNILFSAPYMHDGVSRPSTRS